MPDGQENSGPVLGEALVVWMVDNRPALDERMKEEGSKALIQEFMAAEGGQGLPSPEERLDRARQASARAWLRHLAAAIQANWASAPDDFTASMEKWLTAVMVFSAALGTVWYVILELQTNDVGAIGWSLIGFIWFVIVRRLVYLRGRNRQQKQDNE